MKDAPKILSEPSELFSQKTSRPRRKFQTPNFERALWVRTKMVSPNFLLAQETMLRTHNLRIQFNMVEIKTASINQGLTSVV